MPEISIIVPVYNVEKYLHSCIDSILTQTFTDFELVLIDDGSTDSSGDLCDTYAEKDNRIRVFHQTNQGQGAARNFGVKKAKTDWIHFVDSDDVIHPQMLEVLYGITKLNNTPISVCSIVEDYQLPPSFCKNVGHSSYIMPIDEKAMLNLFEDIPYIYWISCGKLIKKEILLKHPFECGKIYEDNAVVCRWLYDAKKISITNECLYFYRINSEGTTKKGFNIKHCDFLWALQKQIEFFKGTDYQVLLTRICKRYLVSYKTFYNKITSLIANKKFASSLKKQALLFLIINFRVFIKDKYDLLLIFETFFPKQYYSFIKIKKYLY